MYLVVLILHIKVILNIAPFEIKNKQSCKNAFYESTKYNCQQCEQNTQYVNVSYCACPTNYRRDNKLQIGHKGKCTQCANGEVLMISDDTSCIKCSNIVNNACQCGSNQAIQEIKPSGDIQSQIKCITCQSGSYRGSTQKCSPCKTGYQSGGQNNQCTCLNTFTQAQDKCISKQNLNDVVGDFITTGFYTIELNNIVDDNYRIDPTVQQRTSGTYKYLYLKSMIGCAKYKDIRSCQIFANLCVFTNFNLNSNICKKYITQSQARNVFYQNINGWYQFYPWIIYQQSGNFVLKDMNLKLNTDYQYNSTRNRIQFYINTYTFDGQYLGLSEMTDQLMLCQSGFSYQQKLKLFGYIYSDSCEIDVKSFFGLESYAYELFIKDGTKYYPIPVLVKNLKNQIGEYPNIESQESKQLTRRFYIYDTVTGKNTEQDYLNNKNPQYVQIVKSIEIVYQLIPNQAQGIYTPHLVIEYQTKLIQDNTKNFKVKTSLKTNYIGSSDELYTTVSTLFIIANVFVGILWLQRTYIWIKKNKDQSQQQNYQLLVIITTLSNLIDVWGSVMFYFLYLVSKYVFVFFKLQKSVYTYMNQPDLNDKFYNLFSNILISLFALKLYSIVFMIIQQSQVDVFFLDWEKPIRDDRQNGRFKVSVWRRILVANKFNELIRFKYVKDEITFLIFAFLMIGLQLDKLSNNNPSIDLNIPDAQFNFVLAFYISSTMLLLIQFIQYLIGHLSFVRQKSKQFLSLLTMNNISVFIFDELIHGYYLHGVCPGGVSDVNAHYILHLLDNESKGMFKPRGLISYNPNDPNLDQNLQTFEIYIPFVIRTLYNNYILQVDNLITQQLVTIKSTMAIQNPIEGIFQKVIPQGFRFDTAEKVKDTVNNYLKYYLQDLVNDRTNRIIHKPYIIRLLEISPEADGNPIFFKDTDQQFLKVFFCGNEHTVGVFLIIVYTFTNSYISNSTFLAIFITYIFMQIIYSIKNYLQQRNLVKKSLVDDQFMI